MVRVPPPCSEKKRISLVFRSCFLMPTWEPSGEIAQEYIAPGSTGILSNSLPLPLAGASELGSNELMIRSFCFGIIDPYTHKFVRRSVHLKSTNSPGSRSEEHTSELQSR